MSNGCIGFVRAGEFHIAGKSVLTGCVGVTVYQTVIFIIAPNIREKHRSMAFPVDWISIPEYLPVICFIVDFGQFSTVVGDLYTELVIFKCVDHTKNLHNV